MKQKLKSKSGYTLVELLVAFVIVIILLAVLGLVLPTGFWVPESKAVKALQVQGFSDVKIVHRAVWFIQYRGGERTDKVRFTATATNPAGKRVTVYVFSGWLFKGATIRSL